MNVGKLLGSVWLTGCALVIAGLARVLTEQQPDQPFRRFEAGHPELAGLQWPHRSARDMTTEVDAFLERLFAG